MEGDIHACFDSFDHHVVIDLLKKRIDDEAFIQLIWKFLKAGYMEQWTFNRTYSGVPQGSGVSPVLANIYLHELDKFMENYACLLYTSLQDMKFDHDRLNEIVDIILETVCTSRKKIRIAGDDYPAELVKSKFMKLDSEHIRFVLDCMQENTTKIRNIKQYLKAVLFNAPSTIDSYYTSLVAHDMASGALSGKPKYGDPDYYTYNEGESL